jgi:uncharacterized protein (DUF362 family)
MNPGKDDLNRRQFLKASAAGLALVLSGKPALLPAQEKIDLAVVSGDPAAATRKALEALGGIVRFVKRGQKVVLKPNMSFPRPPESGSNTHPEVVATVARACTEAGASQVLVLDYTLGRPEPCLERSGIREACKNIKNVYVLAPHERKFFREVKVPQGKALDRIEVLKDVLESDVLISLPVAKSHSATGISMGLKGLMGLIWDRTSFHDKYNINEAIADMASVIKPQLTVLDATRALVSGGPAGPGEVVKPNLVIAGTDPVAVDSFGVSVAPWYGQNFKGTQVEHLVAAQRRGLGEIDLERMKIFRAKA